MFQFFGAAAGLVETVASFIVSIIVTSVFVIVNIVRPIGWLVMCFSHLSSWMVSFVVVPISLTAVFQVFSKGS